MDRHLYLAKNVGDADRLIRVALGAVLIAYPAVAGLSVLWIAILAALGGSQLMAAITGY